MIDYWKRENIKKSVKKDLDTTLHKEVKEELNSNETDLRGLRVSFPLQLWKGFIGSTLSSLASFL